MDIIVRGIDPYSIKKINEYSKKKNISRQQFLKNLIENWAIIDDIKTSDERYEQLCSILQVVIEQNTKVYEKVLEKIDVKEREIFE